MVAHGQPHPAALTESAREARKSFHCDLCNKGYGRINELEAHESSYDHLHKKRLKDLRHMTRDPSAPSRARRQEQKANPISIKPLTATTTASTKAGGFKKGGFKNAFASAATTATEEEEEEGVGEEAVKEGEVGEGEKGGKVEKEGESESEDDGLREEERYDPRRPTGCWKGCEGWKG
ncbi:MAG: hypothetical protein LQ339_004631 [Xanthoria mediterranea]|nr:MAG: hypothetical protein LQ339_004631 [Xanthoria mediterranea]